MFSTRHVIVWSMRLISNYYRTFYYAKFANLKVLHIPNYIILLISTTLEKKLHFNAMRTRAINTNTLFLIQLRQISRRHFEISKFRVANSFLE